MHHGWRSQVSRAMLDTGREMDVLVLFLSSEDRQLGV